jgi:purine-nucleoside/S-methyl-5'-thioadenosine phosphorylase / adenosine deaminase
MILTIIAKASRSNRSERWYNRRVRRVQEGGIVFYQPEAMARFSGLRQAVATRHGGVSPAPFDSLNLGASVGDDRANVGENLLRLHQALDLDARSTVDARQAQAGEVALVAESERGARIPDVDALITNVRGIPLMLRFADCVPILLYDPVHRAIGLAHAGWRGTVAKVAVHTVRAMADAFDTEPGDLYACVGPSIGPCCYQIGADVVAQVDKAFPEPNDVLIRRNGSLYFDLWNANARLLRELGVGEVEVAAICTADHTEDFYSWRRENARTGRFAAVMSLEG